MPAPNSVATSFSVDIEEIAKARDSLDKAVVADASLAGFHSAVSISNPDWDLEYLELEDSLETYKYGPIRFPVKEMEVTWQVYPRYFHAMVNKYVQGVAYRNLDDGDGTQRQQVWAFSGKCTKASEADWAQNEIGQFTATIELDTSKKSTLTNVGTGDTASWAFITDHWVDRSQHSWITGNGLLEIDGDRTGVVAARSAKPTTIPAHVLTSVADYPAKTEAVRPGYGALADMIDEMRERAVLLNLAV